jgi:hypothetical protein
MTSSPNKIDFSEIVIRARFQPSCGGHSARTSMTSAAGRAHSIRNQGANVAQRIVNGRRNVAQLGKERVIGERG